MKCLLSWVCIGFLVAGCGRPEPPSQPVAPSATASPGETSAGAGAADPIGARTEPATPEPVKVPVPRVADLAELDHDGLKARVKIEAGKVTMVAAWATWCAPCIEEMPTLAAFYREHQDKGLKVMGLCMDDRTPMKDKIQEVLERIKVPFPMVMVKEGGQEAFMKAVEPSWEGSLPVTLVFDAGGERVAFFKEALTEEVLQRRVLPLLEKK